MKMLLPLFFWASVFLTFMTPMELGDVWWHLRSGQLIVENGSIPTEDPFALPFELYSGPFVLREFWLCQIFLYLVYSAGGFVSLIVLKALLFTATVFVLDRTLKLYGIGAPLRYLFLLPLVALATGYDEIRPQSFSFLFFSLTLYLLERQRAEASHRGAPSHGGATGPSVTSHGGATGPSVTGHGIFLLPPLMLLWGNVHGGIVMGMGVSGAYALNDALRRRWRLTAVVAASVLAAALNPNGLYAFSAAKGMFRMSQAGTTTIHEHLPFRAFATMTGEWHLYYVLLAAIALGALSFAVPLLRRKRLDVLGIVLFAGLAYAALTSFKAGLFFMLLAVAVAGKNLSGAISGGAAGPRANRAFNYLLSAALLALSISVFFPRTIFSRPVIDERLMPVKAAQFIERASLPGNIYHPYEWGGYLIWRLYPKYKVFIDGRAIGPMDDHNDVLMARPQWRAVLDRYGVNTAAYWPLLPYEGRVPPIIFALLRDEGWEAVYWDLQGIVFVRRGLAPNPIRKTAVYELLTSLISLRIMDDPSRASNHTALGEVYLERGLKSDAEGEFRNALAIDPGEKRAAFYLQGSSRGPQRWDFR